MLPFDAKARSCSAPTDIAIGESPEGKSTLTGVVELHEAVHWKAELYVGSWPVPSSPSRLSPHEYRLPSEPIAKLAFPGSGKASGAPPMATATAVAPPGRVT